MIYVYVYVAHEIKFEVKNSSHADAVPYEYT